ncbi:pickpocket protein 28-like [Battus philenor]|uniref:pickpocket protein 28-like n=1 Tax=Battus philenor TaxID=42288 RepID=UPI0035D04570
MHQYRHYERSGSVEIQSSVSECRESIGLKNRPRNGFKEYLIDYTLNTNLHGLKYIGGKEQTYVEKFFWFFMFTCCVILSAGIVSKAWTKWYDTPAIIHFQENSTPLWKIPFPAVTVCYETKSLPTRFNYTKYYHLYKNNITYMEMTEHERNMFEDLSLICHERLAPANGRKFSNSKATVENLKQVVPNINEFFLGCKWKDVPRHTCSETFSSILTDDGFCYTFNIMVAEELFRMENLHKEYRYLENINTSQKWSLQGGYRPTAPLETYPHRGLGYGMKAGLTFILRSKDKDLDYICKGPVQGFKILLHNPAELPRMSQLYLRLPLSHEVILAVKPKMTSTSDGLKPYHPSIRQCYLPRERYLRYFKVYTQANCEIECLTNFTYARCGCVHFGMPHGPCMSVCNAGSVACMKKAQIDLLTVNIQVQLEKELVEEETVEEARKVVSRCKCLPACTSLEYEVETSQAEYNWRDLFTAYNIPNDDEMLDQKFTRVVIFFKEALVTTSLRSKLYDLTDLLATCGGLLGLFLGFSVLSLAEILYFLTLRICCTIWRKKKIKNGKLDKNNAHYISSPKPVVLKDNNY